MPTGKRHKEVFSRKRLKRRYFFIEFVFSDDDDRTAFQDFFTSAENPQARKSNIILSNFITGQFRRCWGEWGESLLYSQHFFTPKPDAANMTITWFNPHTRLAIVRVERNLTDMFQRMVPFIKRFRVPAGDVDLPCTLRILHIGGSLRKSKESATQYQLKLLRELQLKEHEIELQMKNLVEKHEKEFNA